MSFSETGWAVCPLCREDVTHDPTDNTFRHPFSDECPLDQLVMYPRHMPGWNRRDVAKDLERVIRANLDWAAAMQVRNAELKAAKAELETTTERADALEDALRFYADDATDSKTDRPWAASDDFGYRARIALAQHGKVK